MRIGLFADAHDHLDHIRKAVEVFNGRNCELVLFAGDLVSSFAVPPLRELRCPVLACFGDNEGNRIGVAAGFKILGQIGEAKLDPQRLFARGQLGGGDAAVEAPGETGHVEDEHEKRVEQRSRIRRALQSNQQRRHSDDGRGEVADDQPGRRPRQAPQIEQLVREQDGREQYEGRPLAAEGARPAPPRVYDAPGSVAIDFQYVTARSNASPAGAYGRPRR